MKDSEIDELVESIKEPLRDLDEVYAELVMAHSYFEVVCTIAIYQGKGTAEEIRQRILSSLEAFLEANPFPHIH